MRELSDVPFLLRRPYLVVISRWRWPNVYRLPPLLPPTWIGYQYLKILDLLPQSFGLFMTAFIAWTFRIYSVVPGIVVI